MNASGDPEVVALYWTVSGPVEVHTGREWSLFDFRDRCEQAARTGFSGIGLWHADIEHQLEQRSLEEMKQIFDGSGLRYLELEFLQDWFLDEDDEQRRASDERRRFLFEAAAVMEPHHIKVGNIPGTPCERPQVAERYAELCADAARYTDAKVLYEFMPHDPIVHGVDTAVEVIGAAEAPNGGVLLDTWHLGKLDITPDELRRLPPKLLGWVELSDGQVENMPDPVDETVNHRRLPGEGEFDIPGYVAACRDIGYDGPWGVEVLSEELRNLPFERIFERAYETAVAQLAVALR
jgi:sugar phosphate isomerase/epimerase